MLNVLATTYMNCSKCGGYLMPPSVWCGTGAPKMCTCYVKPSNVGWICSRCGKSHSPYKGSCDCTPQYTNKSTQ